MNEFTITVPTIKPEQAKRYAQAIDDLILELHYITPRDIVEAAKPVSSPLHDYFEWNIQKAAEAYWEEQAKHLVRHVHTVVETIEGTRVEIRAFHSVTTSEGPRYTNLQIISENDEHREEVVQKAYHELLLWRQKYQIYSEFFSIVQAIENLQL